MGRGALSFIPHKRWGAPIESSSGSLAERAGIPGIGAKKRAEFGALVTAEIADYLRTNSRIAFE